MANTNATISNQPIPNTKPNGRDRKAAAKAAIAKAAAIAASADAPKADDLEPTVGTDLAAAMSAIANRMVTEPDSKPAEAKAKAAKARTPKPATRDCKCGCGRLVRRHFAQGHDARFHGWMTRLAGGEDAKEIGIPASALKLMALNADGIPTRDYDGSTNIARWIAVK